MTIAMPIKPIIKTTIKNVIIKPIRPTNIQTTIAMRNPVLCRELIITQLKIHPIIGIHPINAITSAVTNTEPNPVFLDPFTTDNAIFKNTV